ncbi:ATP synthase subunit C [Tardisphaera miroshnichenkoae]
MESSYKGALKELEAMVLTMKQEVRKKYSKVVLPLVLLAFALAVLVPGSFAQAANSTATNTALMKGYMAIGMGLAVGLAGIGAGFAIAGVGASTVSATVEKPESFTRGFIIVTLGEALAIYGLIVSILIWISF